MISSYQLYGVKLMSKEDLKKINSEISNDTYKKIKIISIQKEITLSECIKDILDKYANSKKNEGLLEVE